MQISLVYASPGHSHIFLHTCTYHSCQVSRIGRDSPGFWPYVPVVSRFTWFCSIVPESSSIAQMEVWHKHKLSTLSNFSPYKLSRCLMGVAIHNRPKVGVVIRKWAWSIKFRARYLYIVCCPGLSSHKLGNYDVPFSACNIENMAVACG